jgi:integrase
VSGGSALRAQTIESDTLRDTRHQEARSAQELKAWLQWLELGGFGSCDAYERTAAVLLNRHPDRAFAEFTADDVADVLMTFPAKSRRIRKAHLNNWFTWGYRTRRIPANPVDLLPVMKRHSQPVIDIFTETEQAALEALPLPDGPLMTLLFETGLRREEACQMRVERIDFGSGMVVVKEGAKRGKDRLVPIVPSLAGAIDRLITEEGLQPSDYLWYDKPGGGFSVRLRRNKPVAPTSFGRWWYRCLDEANVAYVKRDPARGITGRGNPHAARHTFATRWRSRGLELDDLSQILGHSSVAITSDLYVHTGTREIGSRMLEKLEARV